MRLRFNNVFALAAIAAFTGICVAPDLYGATITYRQGVDGYAHLGSELRELNVNNGSGAFMGWQEKNVTGWIGGTAGGRTRTILGFDLDNIPAGSTITSITLDMIADSSNLHFDQSAINLHQVQHATELMVELESNFNLIRVVAPGGTAPADVPWATAGGDYSPTALASIAGFTSADPSGARNFASSAGFVAAAQGALDNGNPLELILVSPGTEAEGGITTHSFVRWWTDDAAIEANRPLLTVNYVPEPASLGLIGIGALCGLRRRSR